MSEQAVSDAGRMAAEGAAALEAAAANLASALALPKDTPGAQVLDAIDAIGRPLDGVRGRAGLASCVHPDPKVREAAESLQQDFEAFGTELGLNRELYERLAAVELPADASPEQQRLQVHGLRNFARSGVDRDEATRGRIRELQDELVTVGQAFDRNIIEGARELVLEGGHAELAGLPADYLEAHPEDEQGRVTLSTDPADAMPVMLYAESDSVRRRLSFESNNRAYPTNVPVLGRLLELRHELSGLLGYESWAAFATEDKMVGSASAAQDFVSRVVERARPAAGGEYDELLAELRNIDPGAERIEPHQLRYLEERVKRGRLAFDSQEVRPYLAYGSVQAGVLGVAERLYGVQFRPAPDLELWHADVQAFEVLLEGRVVARFYLDMWPRDDKYKHAAMFDLASGMAAHGDQPAVLPEAALVCNFPKPEGDDPGLLLHSQVTTFFHEFGHLLHHLFAGEHRYLEFSGITTEWDFVEVPSQLFEEWAWDAAVLGTFAFHHETGEAIPGELVERLRAAEEYGKGLQVLAQMVFASLSLSLHAQDPKELDPVQEYARLRRELTPFEEPSGHHFPYAFGHLGGYSAIYYTYMWSLVISKDLWGAFAQAPMDAAVAQRYRELVLAPGGSQDAADLVRGFLGRDYAFDAWEHWLQA